MLSRLKTFLGRFVTWRRVLPGSIGTELLNQTKWSFASYDYLGLSDGAHRYRVHFVDAVGHARVEIVPFHSIKDDGRLRSYFATYASRL